MAKLVVLSCEICGVIDSVENRVVTANVCGHRVELCKNERVQLLKSVGISEAHAIAYLDRFDEKAGTQGANPSMAQVLAEVAEQLPAVEPAEGQAESAVEDLVLVPAAEDTEVEATPVRKRR